MCLSMVNLVIFVSGRLHWNTILFFECCSKFSFKFDLAFCHGCATDALELFFFDPRTCHILVYALLNQILRLGPLNYGISLRCYSKSVELLVQINYVCSVGP